ncbi:hypothetical protein GCM10020358_13980 [Amorphoplanes nipponensis]|uniref:UspA domain-containing protein n=1 Tax=Actinoplanes nipponensis TaxID=135950 RepID=A0A919JRI8_9ACTN|nr:universal stress protein [Actinoplanes nipponensis]GIE54130.1 hypothetical protein Ani05nite_76640 [Actinoplanes nipponensis]
MFRSIIPAPGPAPVAQSAAGAVVVGVDDSPAGHTAVVHAAIEAELHHRDLRLLHVQPAGGAGLSARDHGARLLERTTERVRACAPAVAVSGHLAFGAAATVLLAELADDDLVVLGDRSGPAHAAFGLCIGERVAACHRGPALVVRLPGLLPRPGLADRPIVVGVDDPSRVTPALDFARTEARLRGCELVVLHAAGDGPVPPGRREGPDGVRVYHHAVAGEPAAALLAASADAAALVVGRHSGDGAATPLAGPVCRALVRGAACPVFLIG